MAATEPAERRNGTDRLMALSPPKPREAAPGPQIDGSVARPTYWGKAKLLPYLLWSYDLRVASIEEIYWARGDELLCRPASFSASPKDAMPA